MVSILSIISSFSGGVLVGGAMAAFVTLIQIFPRFVQLIEKEEYLKFFEDIFVFSSVLFSIIYFSNFSINVGKLMIVIIGLIIGTFLGFFSSALAETLNVLPVIAKKFKIKKRFGLVVIALLLGKTLGSLYYFIILIGGNNGKLK